MSLTTDRNDQCLYESDPLTGMNKCYLVLSEEELAKGFKRPVRQVYKHLGKTIELEGADGTVFTQFIPCNAVTHMGLTLSETWARDPWFYSHTYCTRCKTHLPVEEFQWDDGNVLGS